MIETESRPYRVAVLDLNAGHPNQGMRCISEVVYRWAEENNIEILYDVYDVRVKNELPDTSYDMYISSGGPGDPLSSRFDDWDINWNKWLRNIIRWNENPQNLTKKIRFPHLSLLSISQQILQCRSYLQKKVHLLWHIPYSSDA